MKRLQKILSLMLVVAIVITTIPVQVFAEDIRKLSAEISSGINAEKYGYDDRVYELFKASKIQSDISDENNATDNAGESVNVKNSIGFQPEDGETNETEQVIEDFTEVEEETGSEKQSVMKNPDLSEGEYRIELEEITDEDSEEKLEILEILEDGTLVLQVPQSLQAKAASEYPFAMEIPDLTDMKAPYNYNYNSQESVNFESGSFQYQKPDISLPGSNGFDLNIGHVYDSSQAYKGIMTASVKNIKMYDVYLILNIKWKGFAGTHEYKIRVSDDTDKRYFAYKTQEILDELVDFFEMNCSPGQYLMKPGNGETEIVTAKIKSKKKVASNYSILWTGSPTDNKFLSKTYGLGYGWCFSLPAMEVEKETIGKETTFINRLHMGDGRVLTYKDDLSGFKKYKLSDIKSQNYAAVQTLQTNDGRKILYNRTITLANGEKWYFKATETDSATKKIMAYQLTAMQNRFGDSITLSYSSDLNDMRAVGNYILITDTVGREVKIERTSKNELVMSLPDNTKIKYNTDGVTLGGVTDQINRITTYETVQYEAPYRYVMEELEDKGSMNHQLILKKIIHPTGLQTQLNYIEYPNALGSLDGQFSEYLISERKDVTPNEVNKYAYEYTHYFIKSSSTQYINKTTVTQNNVKRIYEFNRDHLMTSFEIKEGESSKAKEQYTYDSYNLINKKTTTIPLARTDEWTHDSRGNVLTATVASNIPEFKNAAVMKYDDMYYLPLTRTLQMNSSTKVQEEYTLSSDKKVVEWKKVYELTGTNFSTKELKEAVQYIYDNKFHLIEQREYLISNGIVSASYRSNNFSYQNNNPELSASFDGAYLTRQWTTGVLNHDGTLLKGDGIIENTFKYDKNGRLIEKKDPNGNISRISYDAVGRIVKEVNPDGTEVRKEYNDSNNWLITTDQSGFKMKYQFDSLGQISEVVDLKLNNWISRYYYNSKGLLQEQQSNLGNKVRKQNILYDWNDRPISDIFSSNDEILYAETYEYHDAVENKYSQVKKTVEGGTNSENIITTIYTDILGRLCKEGSGNTGTQYFNLYEYDLVGNKTKSTDAKGSSYQYTYDYAGRILTDKNPDGKIKTNTYDALGNLKSSTDYANSATTYEYDMNGRLLIQSNPFEGTYKSNTIKLYDKNGNIISEKIQNNKIGASISYSVVNYRYNTLNQLTNIINVNPDGDDVWTRYEYDERGNQKVVYTGALNETNAGTKVTYYEYDYRNRLTKMTDAMGQSELYEYNISGNLIKKTDRNKHTIDYTYDPLSRVIMEKSDYQFSSSLSLNNHLNSSTGKTYEYGGNGLLKAEDNGQHRITYTYDNRGNVILVFEGFADSISGYNVIRSQAYTYDEVGNRIKFKAWERDFGAWAQGIDLMINQKYSYDKMNRLGLVQADLKTSDLSGVENYIDVAKYEYDSNSNVKNVYYPRKHTSSPLQKYEYNAANMVKSVTNYNTKGANLTPYLISTFKYTYQLDGNQIEKNSDTHDSVQYQYDALGRLIRESVGSGEVKTYTFDRFGNRVGMVGNNNSSVTYQYDNNNRLISTTKVEGARTTEVQNYQYDKNGNQIEELLSIGGTATAKKSYNYDYNNKLVMVENQGTYWYSYRADGYLLNRVEKSNNGDLNSDRFYWDQGYMYAQDGVKASENGLVRNGKLQKFVRGVGLQTVLRSDNSKHDGTDVYYFYNGHGDVVDTIDGSASQLISKYEYDAYGNQKNSSVIDEYNPIRYAGEYYDAASGLIYLRGRFYNPETGRFINEDSIRDGLNWYAYCGNNPIRYVDPSGQVALELVGVSVSVAAVLAAAAYYVSTPAGQKVVHDIASSISDSMSITTDAFRNIIYTFDEASEMARSFAYEAVRTKKEFEEFSNNSIYVLFDLNNEIRYVGRTNNPPIREGAHKRDKSLVRNKSEYNMQVIMTGLDLKTARGMEQLFIAAFTGEALVNARREIALKNMGKFSHEMERAAEIIASSEIDGVSRDLSGGISRNLSSLDKWIKEMFK